MQILQEALAEYSVSSFDVGLLVLCGFIIGAAKAGVKGLGNIVIPVMAIMFGAKPSTGILLPILIMGDMGAVYYYRKATNWYHLKKLLPAAVIGVLVATWVGNAISAITFKYLLAILILLSVFLLIIWERNNKNEIPVGSTALGYGIGIAAGFSTMIGNAAGPITNIYLLMVKLPKNAFIATAAWFFYFINIFKVPFHIFFWKTINWNTLLIDVVAIPGIFVGLFAGIYLVKLMSESFFRWLVIVTTVMAAFLLLIN